MKKEETFNTFSDGLILDLNPLSMPNTALSNCLNGTILTYNGNENMLLNDMGNCRVETAMLPTGYIPLGSTSFGGIIYIVSYNPIDKKYLIGSFPSPERNLSKDELGDESITTIYLNKFCSGDWKNSIENDVWKFGHPDNIITNYYQKVNLFESAIYPGDKYKVFSNNIDGAYKFISAWEENNTDITAFPKLLRFEIVSTLKNGKVINISDKSVWTNNESKQTKIPYYIYNGSIKLKDNNELDLDEYRGLVSSNYDTYVNNESGQLGIVARLEVPTSFSVGYDVLTERIDNEEYYQFYFYLNWANDITNPDYKHKNNVEGIKCTISIVDNTDEFSYNFNSEDYKYPKDEDDNYLTIEAPDNFYEDNFDLENYLTNIKNKKGIDKRHNDGTDFLYVVKGPKIKKADQIITMDIIPTVSFGLLVFLKKTLTIDTSKLYKGTINLLNYNYYVDSDNIKVNFNVESYPESGKSITKESKIKLYSLDNYINNSEFINQETYDSEYNENLGLSNSEEELKISEGIISGALEVSISRKNLIPNTIYIAQFEFDYSGRKRYFYRLLFNAPIFNNAYGKVGDFKDLYLYNSEVDYGIKFKLNYNSDSINTVSPDPNNVQPSKISTVKEDKNISQTYNISHELKSSLDISTGLDDLSVVLSDENLNPIITVDYNSEVKVDLVDTPNVIVDPTTKQFSINNRFNCIIPYTLQYNKLEALTEYDLVLLTHNPLPASLSPTNDSKDSSNNTKNILAVWVYGEGREGGQLKLHINGVNKVTELINNDEERKSIDTNSIESLLYSYMTEHDYDYLNLYIGVLFFGDGNCGWGRSIDNAYLGYRFGGKNGITEGTIKLRLIKANAIRYNGSVKIIHNKDINLYNLSYNLNSYDFTHGNDCSIIKDNLFYKYKSSGTSKWLFSLGSFKDPILNPMVVTKYDVQFNTNVKLLIIGGNSINIESVSAHNLKLINLSKTVIDLELINRILNEDFMTDMLSFTNNYAGYSNDLFLSNDDIHTVKQLVNSLYLNVSFLTIDDKEIVSFDLNKSLKDTEWYFAWESIDGNGLPDSGSVTKDYLLDLSNKYGERQSCILKFTKAYGE